MTHKPPTEVVIARTSHLQGIARDLVTRMYAREGYIEDGVAMSPLSSYIGKAHTTTLISFREAVPVGTVSIVVDCADPLPMDTLFLSELRVLRTQGARLGEVCQFAIDHEDGYIDPSVSITLFGHTLRTLSDAGCTHAVCVVNPRHAAFYQSLGGERLGEEKAYPGVNGAPAQAYVVDLRTLEHRVLASENPILTKIWSVAHYES